MPDKAPKPLTKTQQKVSAICDKALEEMQQKVLAHYQAHPDSAWSGHHLVDLEKTVKEVYRSMGLSIGDAFRDGLNDQMRAMYDKAYEDVKKAGRRNAILGKPNVRLVKDYLKSSFEEIAMRTTQMSFDHVRALRSMAADVLRTASLTGASRAEVTKQFLARAEEIPGFKFTAANGRQWSNKAYFNMLARTELMNAGRAAYDQKCADEGCDLVQLDVSGNCCEACARWEGKIFSLTGATKGYPTKADLEADGVFHPNCTHRYTAVADWDAVRRAAEEARKEDEEEKNAKGQQQGGEAIGNDQQAPNGKKPTNQAAKPVMQTAKPQEDEAPKQAHREAEERAAAEEQTMRDSEEKHREEHRKLREEQKAAAFEKRKEKILQQSREAAKNAINDHYVKDDIKQEATREASDLGLTGSRAKKYINEAIKRKTHDRSEAFRVVAEDFANQYTPEIAARYGKPPILKFNSMARSTAFGPGRDPSKDFIQIKTTGEDYKWMTAKGAVRHEYGHWLHYAATRKDADLQNRIEKAAKSDWRRLQRIVNLQALEQQNARDSFSSYLFEQEYEDIGTERKHIVTYFADTIGSICNGTGYGDGHDSDYYQNQNAGFNGHIPYSEAIANVRALTKSLSDAKVKEFFPKLHKIIKEIEY